MKLHIFGASGAGVTTLGTALGQALSISYFDSDAYYWVPSEPPFTIRRPEADRDAALAHALIQHPDWILGGSAMSWAAPWILAADLVIFLWLPQPLRLHRLQQRELERYGNVIFTDPTRAEQTRTFLAWAAGYDDNSCGGSRNLANHTEWLGQFTCPVLELRGDFSVAQRLNAVQTKLRELQLK